jgi:hypothetical protein
VHRLVAEVFNEGRLEVVARPSLSVVCLSTFKASTSGAAGILALVDQEEDMDGRDIRRGCP